MLSLYPALQGCCCATVGQGKTFPLLPVRIVATPMGLTWFCTTTTGGAEQTKATLYCLGVRAYCQVPAHLLLHVCPPQNCPPPTLSTPQNSTSSLLSHYPHRCPYQPSLASAEVLSSGTTEDGFSAADSEGGTNMLYGMLLILPGKHNGLALA